MCVYYIYGFISSAPHGFVPFIRGVVNVWSWTYKTVNDKGRCESVTWPHTTLSSSKPLLLRLIYICFIFHVHVIYVRNLKCIIYGGVEWRNIFHTILSYWVMMMIHFLTAGQYLNSFYFVDGWSSEWISEIRILTYVPVITQLLNSRDSGQKLLI